MSRPLRGLLWLAGLAAAAGGVALLGAQPLPEGPGGSWCLFRRLLIPCPGCGMTRAVAALGRGDLAAAWSLHPLSLLLALEAVGLGLFFAVRSAHSSGSPGEGRPSIVSATAFEGWALSHGFLFLAVWTGRAATGALPW